MDTLMGVCTCNHTVDGSFVVTCIVANKFFSEQWLKQQVVWVQ